MRDLCTGLTFTFRPSPIPTLPRCQTLVHKGFRHLRLALNRFLECGHVTDEVEGLLLPLVIHPIHESRESRDCCLQLHILPRAVGEELCHEEGLRQEPLNLARSVYH